MPAGETYNRSDARAWAHENYVGACDVILPSFKSDLSGLNEAGIRHDVRRNMELGFWGALLVSECGTTPDEMRQFMEIAVDEAGGEHYFMLHGAFDTANDIIKMTKDAEAIGVDGMLLGHPNSFYPQSPKDILDYTHYICSNVDIGVTLFAAHHFNFDRVDVSGYPTEVMVEAAKTEENVVAVKYEVGRPGVVGTYECFKALAGTGVLVSDPFEPSCPLWTELFDMPWMGTSNYEYWGDRIPKMLDAFNNGRREEGMEIYWQIQPARTTRLATQATFGGANFIHRYLWKYQAWLNGFNGGPLRQPAMKLSDPLMARVKDGLKKAGLPHDVESTPADYFASRNPA
ncbi:MAG: dihydrodipicolinate synthase family protein [Halieaceae bacterium]|nr:dihydrodipicolinate synthase family protein [Halieaceae bacterium]